MRSCTNGRTRTAVTLTAVVAMAALLGACGSTSSPSSAPAKPATPVSASKVLLDSVQTTAATKSARVSLSVSTSGSSQYAVSLKADGAIDFATGDSQMTLTLGGPASAFMPGGIEERIVGGTVYVKLPASIGRLFGGSAGGQWLEIKTGKLGAGTAAPVPGLGESDPTKFLATLGAVSDGVTKVGSVSVRGVETTQYHAVLDLGKAIDQATIPPALRAKVNQLLPSGAHALTIPADIFIDSSGRVRRMTFVENLASFAGAATGASGSTATLPTVTVSMDLYDFGAPVNVQAPPAAQIISPKQFGVNGGGSFGMPAPGGTTSS